MSKQVTPAALAVQGESRTQALAAFTALGLSGAVAAEIREADSPPYARLGPFFEVVDGPFSDAQSTATRVTGSVTFYATQGPNHQQLAEKFINLMTADSLTVSGFQVRLHQEDWTIIASREEDPGGATLYTAIVDHTLTLEPN